MLPIGLEIEVNNGPNASRVSETLLNREVANVKWGACAEHCGYEYKTPILSSGVEIRAALRDVKKLEKLKLSFNNAGTHIHLGMWGVSKKKTTRSVYNPCGNILTKQDYDLIGPTKDFIVQDYADNKSEVFPAIRRMFIASARFADVLRLVQHPDRWVNKYCHSIGSWNEKHIERSKSVKNIASHQNLGQNHRRLSINPLSYQKWGTIEVRLIKASFNKNDISDQVVLFSRLREACFDLERPIPQKSDNTKANFVRLLMDFCQIRGRTLIRLANNLDASLKTKTIPAICYNFDCQNYGNAENYTDYGLSRLVCPGCEQNYKYCAACGSRSTKKFMKKIDDLIVGGRYVCNHNCVNEKTFAREGATKKWSMGVLVGSGFEAGYFNEVEKVKNVLKMSK